jgi:hypothetical protein
MAGAAERGQGEGWGCWLVNMLYQICRTRCQTVGCMQGTRLADLIGWRLYLSHA